MMFPSVARRHLVFACSIFAAVAAALCPAAATRARAQTAFNCSLLVHISVNQVDPNATQANDVTGYTDPVTGDEYAIIGVTTGTGIYNVTRPDSAYQTGFIPGPVSNWRDFANYRNYVYAGSEGGGGIQIIDLANPEAPSLTSSFSWTGSSSSHSITTDTLSARLYVNGAQRGMYILSIANPAAPTELGLYTEHYVHDSYARNDTVFVSAIGSGTQRILDTSDPQAIQTIVSFTTERQAAHNSWPSEDWRYLYVTDETAGGRVTTWDITTLTSPVQIDGYTASPTGDAHNIYVKGDYGFVAHYTSGMRVLDISDPERMIEVAYYDTYFPQSGLFNGDWSAHPFTASGNVYIGDIEGGLYVVSFQQKRGGVVEGVITEQGTGAPLEDVLLRLSGSGQIARTDAMGRYEFRTAEGSYTISAERIGLLPRTVPVTVERGKTTNGNFTLLDNTAVLELSSTTPIVAALAAGESSTIPIRVKNVGGGLIQFSVRDTTRVSPVLPGKRGAARDAVPWHNAQARIRELVRTNQSAIDEAVASRATRTKLAASTPTLRKVLNDPVDDVIEIMPSTAGRVDVTALRAGTDSKEFAIQLESAGATFPDSNAAIFFFDVDQDISTGVVNPVATNFGAPVTHDIGAEIVMIWDLAGNFVPSPANPIAGAALLLAADFSQFFGVFFGEIDDGTATISIPRESIGDDDDNMNFAGIAASFNSDQMPLSVDLLPAAGHVISGSEALDAPWVTATPDTGSVAGGDSATVLVRFDAPDIATNETLTGSLILSTNLDTAPQTEISLRLNVDGVPPAFTLGILQNPILSSYVDLVVVASEPLGARPSLTVDAAALTLDGAFGGATPELRARTTLDGSDPVSVSISGSDILGNVGTYSETFIAYAISAKSPVLAVGPDDAVRLDAPAGAIASGARLILRRADEAGDDGALSPRVTIGPEDTALLERATITIPVTEGASDGAIFRRGENGWIALPTFVSPDRRALVATIDRLGVFQARRGAALAPDALPAQSTLGAATPNPASRGTSIAFALARPGLAQLAVYDLSGRLVRTLVEGNRPVGPAIAQWDGEDNRGRRVAAGTYLYRLETPDGAQARKITVLR
ncbi:MAG: choice-of-anchor B family protein [bacterium]